MPSFRTVQAPARAELVEKRSRFLAEIRPVSDEVACRSFVAELRALHRDARHHCSAWILRSGEMRYSDDGEPQGTAGVPILEVLKRENLTDVALVVTRYFGGTLLGAGGLVRAYSASAKLAVDEARICTMQPCSLLQLAVPYPLHDRILRLASDIGALVLDCDYTDHITLRLRLAAELTEDFSFQLSELSGGSVIPEYMGEVFAAI